METSDEVKLNLIQNIGRALQGNRGTNISMLYSNFLIVKQTISCLQGETQIQVRLDGPTGYAELQLQLMLERICNFLKTLGFGIYIYVYIFTPKTPNTSFL